MLIVLIVKIFFHMFNHFYFCLFKFLCLKFETTYNFLVLWSPCNACFSGDAGEGT